MVHETLVHLSEKKKTNREVRDLIREAHDVGNMLSLVKILYIH